MEAGNKRPQKNSMTDDTITNAVKQSAAGPKKASGDSGSIEQHSLADQIAADKFIESKKASQGRGLGIKLLKISPGGTV